ILTLHYENVDPQKYAKTLDIDALDEEAQHDLLKKISMNSDADFTASLSGADSVKREQILGWRFYAVENSVSKFLGIARGSLREAQEDFAKGNVKDAQKNAVMAYLSGIEPLEARIRAKSPAMVVQLETLMGNFRQALQKNPPSSDEVMQASNKALAKIEEA